MSAIENLKEQARAFEQNEDWAKALDLYRRAIERLEKDDQPEIGLYNRVADIQVRQGHIQNAVANYEKAIDLYVEAELPNNAIAVCKKIVRNLPQRHSVYLRMGQIRGKQGLLADARHHFLTYAERMQREGNVDEGVRALAELADMSPEDAEIRLAVASQMHAQGRTEDAVNQLQAGFRTAIARGLPTDRFEQMLGELGAVPEPTEPAPAAGAVELAGFGDIVLEPPPDRAADTRDVEVAGFEIVLDEPQPPAAQEREEESEPLPLISGAFEGAGAPEPESHADEPPALDFEIAGTSAPDPMGHESLAARGDFAGAMSSLRKLTRLHPDDLVLARRLVEYATQLGDPAELAAARLDLAETLERVGQSAKARPLYQEVLDGDAQNARALAGLGKTPAPARAAPPTTSEGFIDLGSMIFDDEEEKTTRFVVAYEEPTGDEQADFARMLSRFKAKVAENLDADDVKAHQDLGTAYKEMGLLDEAISEFQQALRSSADHLPTYELLGQCFTEKGRPEAAVRTLRRALEAPYEVEDELLGIYYYLGRAYEQLGNTKEALEFYDRVFTLDINFADVTERLRALR